MKILKNIDDFEAIVSIDGGKFGVEDIDAANEFCKSIANSHYENFPVGSILIPKKYRKHFFSVYSFARIADDISDELIDYPPQFRISLLDKLLNLLKYPTIITDSKNNPIALSLLSTMKTNKMPLEPFEKLITAFKQDANFQHPVSMEENIEYCGNSANPIGELVLRIFDNFNNETSELSDSICTGLQLVNFWQDISVDYHKGRIYIPKEFLNKYELDNIFDLKSNNINNLDDCIKDICDITEKFFIFGNILIKLIENKRLKFEIALTIEGGKRILTKSRDLGSGIIHQRPKIYFGDGIIIFLSAFKHLII